MRRARSHLFWVIGLLALLGLAVEVWRNLDPSPRADGWAQLFSLSYEGNVPTWYSSCLLFWCGLFLAKVAARVWGRKGALGWHWAILAAGFFYMSLDEAVGIHEGLGGITRAGGILYFDWILPAAVLVALLAVIYWPFLRRLPPEFRRCFLVAAFIYLGGALAMELPLGYWTSRFGDDNLGYALIDWVEECLELLGATLFLIALGDYSDPAAGKEAR